MADETTAAAVANVNEETQAVDLSTLTVEQLESMNETEKAEAVAAFKSLEKEAKEAAKVFKALEIARYKTYLSKSEKVLRAMCYVAVAYLIAQRFIH